MNENENLASLIDHTLLKPEATSEQVRLLCQEAKDHHFFSVCLNSSWVPLAVKLLQGSGVHTVAVVGFPLGAMSSTAKAFEAQNCVRAGAKEIDMVMAIGHLKERDLNYVKSDIAEVVQGAAGARVKVILETGLLTLEEKKIACGLVVEAGAHFVKTCTGFNVGSATVEDLQLMRSIVGPDFGVKASGGIKTAMAAQQMLASGANRLGTSSGVLLIQGTASVGGY